mgnify:FL=1
MKDTITALATPEGKGGLSVIRVSGPNALAIISAVFVPVNKRKQSLIPWHARSGWLYDPVSWQTVDEVIVLFFKAPKSYTGEDLLEISCHGNPLISSHILDIIISQGARPALPGEFTRRAFENGRIDLSQAEAVAQVTGAESEKATHAAL